MAFFLQLEQSRFDEVEMRKNEPLEQPKIRIKLNQFEICENKRKIIVHTFPNREVVFSANNAGMQKASTLFCKNGAE